MATFSNHPGTNHSIPEEAQELIRRKLTLLKKAFEEECIHARLLNIKGLTTEMQQSLLHKSHDQAFVTMPVQVYHSGGHHQPPFRLICFEPVG